MDAKEIAKEIRKDLKNEFKNTAKFSVRKSEYSGGRSITITIKKASSNYFKTRDEFENEYADWKVEMPSSYENALKRFKRHDYIALKDDFLNTIEKIANKLNWDNSDIISDYYDVNYSLSIVGDNIEVI